ncbi:MAG: PhnD/SsuA/transferrin family substrate-binding protein [Candidatus Promineofilum sp.]|nr:PhnD/SsuA/transferrin family substrate-binding protein [Promineifilum sp.]
MIWSLQLALLLAACRPQNGVSPPTPTASLLAQPTTAATLPAASTAPAPVVMTTDVAETAAPTATSTPVLTATIEATRPAPGSVERPVQLLFPPVAAGAVVARRVAPLVEALGAATGVAFSVGVVDSEAALVELLCAAPEDVVGFLSAAAYTVAHDQCAAQAGLVAVGSDGLTWQMGMLVTRAGDGTELTDLAGKRWAVADTHSLPTYLYFRAQLAAAGIEPGEIVDAPEETTALLSLVNGQVDFTTADFVPPIMPLGGVWAAGKNGPEEWRLLGIPPSRSPIGYVIVAGEPEFGGYRLRDARARLFDTTPEIFDQTRILAVSEPIPNDTVVLGRDIAPELARQIVATLTEFAASDACTMSLCSADLFGWIGLEPAEDSAYDPIRTVKDTLELEAADLWAELD